MAPELCVDLESQSSTVWRAVVVAVVLGVRGCGHRMQCQIRAPEGVEALR